MDYIKEFWQPMYESFRCWWTDCCEQFARWFDEYLRAWWEKFIHHSVDAIKMNCPKDSLIYELADALEHMEVRRMKLAISRRVTDLKQKVSEWCWSCKY